MLPLLRGDCGGEQTRHSLGTQDEILHLFINNIGRKSYFAKRFDWMLNEVMKQWFSLLIDEKTAEYMYCISSHYWKSLI